MNIPPPPPPIQSLSLHCSDHKQNASIGHTPLICTATVSQVATSAWVSGNPKTPRHRANHCRGKKEVAVHAGAVPLRVFRMWSTGPQSRVSCFTGFSVYSVGIEGSRLRVWGFEPTSKALNLNPKPQTLRPQPCFWPRLQSIRKRYQIPDSATARKQTAAMQRWMLKSCVLGFRV